MVKSQQEMLNQISRMMGFKAVEDQKEKETYEKLGSGTEGIPRPHIFVINTSMPLQGASNQEGEATLCQAEPPTQASPNLDEVQE
ncbi:hypothetical protein GQ457_18G007630 [Hibiscus cannabinus]